MNRDSKIIAIVALVVAIVGLGIGFAAFTANLTIDSSAKVTPSASAFKVKFKENTLNCSSHTGSGSASKAGTLADTSISGVEITLTKPGDSVTCTATITAEGDYTAYLTGISTSKLTCSGTGTLGALGTEACKSIKATFSVGAASVTSTTAETTATTIGNDTTLSKGGDTFGTNTFTLKVEYLSSGKPTDEALTITIPKTTLTYETVQGETTG